MDFLRNAEGWSTLNTKLILWVPRTVVMNNTCRPASLIRSSWFLSRPCLFNSGRFVSKPYNVMTSKTTIFFTSRIEHRQFYYNRPFQIIDSNCSGCPDHGCVWEPDKDETCVYRVTRKTWRLSTVCPMNLRGPRLHRARPRLGWKPTRVGVIVSTSVLYIGIVAFCF